MVLNFLSYVKNTIISLNTMDVVYGYCCNVSCAQQNTINYYESKLVHQLSNLHTNVVTDQALHSTP